MKRTAGIITLLLSISSPIIYSQWTLTNGPEGGNILCLEKVGTEIWAGTKGGLYKSNNEGQSWEQSKDLPQDYVVQNIISSRDTTIMLVLSHNLNYPLLEDTYNYLVYSRTSNSQPWQIYQPNTFNTPITGSIFKNKYGLFLDYGRLAISKDLGKSWFECKYPEPFIDVLDIIHDGDRIILNAQLFSTGKRMNFYTDDGAVTWQLMPTFPDYYYHEIFVDKNLILLRYAEDSIYLSNDFGVQWERISIPTASGYAFIHNCRRTDDGNLFITNSNLWRSKNDGYTWELTHSADSVTQYTDVIPLKNGNYLVSSDHGIYEVTPNLKKWTVSNEHLRSTRCSYLFTNPNGDVYATLGDFEKGSGIEFVVSKNGGISWQKVLPDSLSHSVFIFDMLFIGDTIVAANQNNLLFSFDNGIHWNQTSSNYYNTSHSGLARIGGKLYAGSFRTNVTQDWGQSWETIDLTNGNFNISCNDIIQVDTLIFAILSNGQIWKSTNNGVSWDNISDIGDWWGSTFNNKLDYINNILYTLGQDDSNGFVFKYSKDLGQSWQRIGRNGIPLFRGSFGLDTFPITSFTVYENLLIATIPTSGVYISGDMGENWLPFNEELQNLRSTCITIKDSILYLGTDHGGIWKRNDTELKTISGLAWYDDDKNGLRDSGELVFKNAIVALNPSHNYCSTSDHGTYSMITKQLLTDTVTISTGSPYFIANPPYYLVSQTSDNLNFGIHTIPDIIDLSVKITNSASMALEPSQGNSILVTIKNVGTSDAGGILKVNLPLGSILSYTPSPLPDLITTDTLTWNLPTLRPGESLNRLIQFQLKYNDLNVYDILSFSARVLLPDDHDLSNNSDQDSSVVVFTFDPFKKSVSPGPWLSPTEFKAGKSLTYTIRFPIENSPRILDTLDIALDPSTLKILASSHPCTLSVIKNGIVEFTFNYTPTYPQDSYNGFVTFSISPFPNTLIGTIISNQANFIYYDHSKLNPISKTNIVQTKIGFPPNASGYVWYDDNNNSIIDPGENPFTKAIIYSSPSNYYSVSSDSGSYSIITEKLNDTLRIKTGPYSLNSNPPYHLVTNNGELKNFGVYTVPDSKDLSIDITNTQDIRPGFDNSFSIMVKNVGISSTPGIVKFVLPLGLTYYYSQPFPNGQIGDTLFWNIPNLNANQNYIIQVWFHTSKDLKINNKLSFDATVVLNDDQDVSNNHDYKTVFVKRTVELNYKVVSPGAWLTPDQLESNIPLTFTIHFLSTVTRIEYIRIIDTLDEHLDASTFKFISSSIPCKWYLRDKGVVEFIIQHTDLSGGDPYGAGFVKFSVLPFHDTPTNTEIFNKAYVFLRYDPSIVTNTTETKITYPAIASGYVWHDDNNNSLPDPGEKPYNEIVVYTDTSHYYSSTIDDGTYILYAKDFNDTLKVATESKYLISNPPYYIMTPSVTNYNFGVHTIPDIKDLSINITNTTVFRPGFDNSFIITVKNVGTTITTGSVKMNMPYGLINNNSIPIPNIQVGDTLIWDLPQLDVEESFAIQVNFTTSLVLKINEEINFSASLLMSNDNDISNNYDAHKVKVVGSYDPNDKSVDPGPYLTPTELESGRSLIYTIRFENTGNFKADLIYILDTLDASLDASTLKIISSSHPFNWFLKDKGVVEFYFQNINLPFVEPESHGFVKFSISPFLSTTIGTGIPNRAFIYFDFNPAIITNTVETKIGFPVNVFKENPLESLILYPNPTNKNLQFIWTNAPRGEIEIQLYDMKGTLCYQKIILLSDDHGKINLPKLIPGNYQLILENNKRKSSGMISIQY